VLRYGYVDIKTDRNALHGGAMLKLHIQEIRAPLSNVSGPAIAPATSPRDNFGWLDSSLDLECGLDVLDLPVDLLWPDLKEPAVRPPHER
jgi:hypothetical protein